MKAEDIPNEHRTSGNSLMLLISWVVVGVPLAWGVYNTLLKLPALFR